MRRRKSTKAKQGIKGNTAVGIISDAVAIRKQGGPLSNKCVSEQASESESSSVPD